MKLKLAVCIFVAVFLSAVIFKVNQVEYIPEYDSGGKSLQVVNSENITEIKTEAETTTNDESKKDNTVRIVILNNIWLSLINIGAVYVVSGVKFYYVTYVISMLSSLIYMLNLIMVMFRKDNRGLHDMVAGTKVIEVSNDVVVESVEEVKKDGIKEKVDKVSKKKSSK